MRLLPCSQAEARRLHDVEADARFVAAARSKTLRHRAEEMDVAEKNGFYMSEKAKICRDLQERGFSYSEIAERTGLTPTLVNYYLHYEKRLEHARNYAREYHKTHPKRRKANATPPARGKEFGRRMAHFEHRHNGYVHKIVEQLNGEVFYRAPFDVATPDGQFYEVKVTSRTPPLFRLTTEEIKFMEITQNNYHVILVVINESQIRSWLINYGKLKKWYHGATFQGKPMRQFELSQKRLRSLSPFGLKQNVAGIF